jgi:AhpD family alkylhydroperoxidase
MAEFDPAFELANVQGEKIMTRLAAVDSRKLPPEWKDRFESASPRERMLLTPTLHAPDLMSELHGFASQLRAMGTLSDRLVELVRLRVAFHNQCRSCMAMRYPSGLEDGVTDELVCSLERPREAPGLTDAERAALAYADISATDHFAINDETFTELRQHFSEREIVELGLHIAYFIGFGRLVAAWDMVEELPGDLTDKGTEATPWSVETFIFAS